MNSIQRGVTAGLPSKVSHPRWNTIADSVRQLPPCWIREDFLFWELCWKPLEITDSARLDAVLKLAVTSGKKLMLNVVPCPFPDAEEWKKRVGGAWDPWMRPDFRIWEPIRETLGTAIDYCVRKWESLGGAKANLVFEWYNEPATGHVSGGNADKEAKGTWNPQFHAFCNYLLVGSNAVDFHGYKLVGPTLSMFGEGDAERQELKTALGGSEGQWWSKMQRRCVNLGIYLPRAAKSADEASDMYRVELERIIGLMKGLAVAPAKSPIRIHEWYVSKPMLGYRNGECEDSFRADCIVAIGEVIASYRDIEAAFFFTHFYPPEQVKSPYDDHSAFSGPARTAMVRFLSGKG
ncbi:MAG: hypothetical protein JST51_13940 [Armatimonadetes bacterium]|nr:hypothetical protein [Armatimonadota bacterium]